VQIPLAGVSLKISPVVSRPHHVHFFQNFLEQMESRGHDVLLFHTGNELTKKLLEPLSIDDKIYGRSFELHTPHLISSFYNKTTLLKDLKGFDSDLILSVNGLPSCPFNSLLGVPSVVFLDTEPNRHEKYFIYNYADKIISPECYHADLPKQKLLSHSSYHPLAYLHPNYFSSDRGILDELDIGPKNYVIASFGSHIERKIDLKRHPLRRRQMIDLVRELEDHCEVFVDERSYVPKPLKDYCPSIHPSKYLDLLAEAALVIGDNPVVSAEAGVLGTPWIYISNYTTCTLEDQEIQYDIGSQITNLEEAKDLADMILTDELKLDTERARKKILKDKTDLTKWMVTLVRAMRKFGYLS